MNEQGRSLKQDAQRSAGEDVGTRGMDETLASLDGHKTTWARLPIRAKIQYLKEVRALALTHAPRWADAETAAKQLRPGSPLVGAESWLPGPYGLIAWLTGRCR